MSMESTLGPGAFALGDAAEKTESRVVGRSSFMMFGTAYLEGLSVLIVEIAGARALAPFFGTSLQVWTSQITATLFFLALGYGLGGKLARISGRWTVPVLFITAGIWLTLYPLMRTP